MAVADSSLGKSMLPIPLRTPNWCAQRASCGGEPQGHRHERPNRTVTTRHLRTSAHAAVRADPPNRAPVRAKARPVGLRMLDLARMPIDGSRGGSRLMPVAGAAELPEPVDRVGTPPGDPESIACHGEPSPADSEAPRRCELGVGVPGVALRDQIPAPLPGRGTAAEVVKHPATPVGRVQDCVETGEFPSCALTSR